mgnify:CR=1 FL=1
MQFNARHWRCSASKHKLASAAHRRARVLEKDRVFSHSSSSAPLVDTAGDGTRRLVVRDDDSDDDDDSDEDYRCACACGVAHPKSVR